MPSKLYGDLQRAIIGIRSELLDFSKRVDGNYSDKELLKCRAFVTFCHAEIENFLEDWASKLVDKAVTRWTRHRSAGPVLSSLLAYRSENVGIADKLNEQAADKRIDSVIRQAANAQQQVIRHNHGIRQRNFSALFLPLGLQPNVIDEALLIKLDNLGGRRGDLVHVGHAVSIRRIRDPFDDEDSDIRMLISELVDFDSVAMRLT